MNFSLRRSTRTRKNEVLDFQDPMPTKKRTLSKCKTDVKEQQNEHQQQEDYPVFTPHQAKSKGNQQLQPKEGELRQEEHHLVTPEKSKEHQQLQEDEEPQEEIAHHFVTLPLEKSEEHQEEEDHSVTLPPAILGHRVEADEVANTGSVEVIPIDICSWEEMKPIADPLSLLQPVSKPNYQLVKVPQESLKQIMDVAVIFKSALVSHLENLAHSLDIATMVRSANECFKRMTALEVDYQTFHGQISRLIEYYQKLKESTEGKNLELEAAYEASVIEADDAKNELQRAETDLLSAQTNNNSTREKIKELKESLAQLKAQDAAERNRFVSLTAERDRCHEAHLCSIRKVDRLYFEHEGKVQRGNAIREEIETLLRRLKGS